MAATFLSWLLTVNGAIALSYLYYTRIVKKQKYGLEMAAVILFCPVAGAFCLAGAHLISGFLKDKEPDYEHLSFRKDKRVSVRPADTEAAYYMAPFEDILRLGSNSEKRIALLRILKQERHKTISYITNALGDEDTETSHYAASAVLSYTQERGGTISRLVEEYKKSDGSLEKARLAAEYIRDYLDSGTLSQWEKIGYERLIWEVMEAAILAGEEEATGQDYRMLIRACRGMGEEHKAQLWGETYLERFPQDEGAYLILLPLYYDLGEKEEFFRLLNRLKESEIMLSREGIAQLRFWMGL